MNWICKICNESDFINDDIYIICQNCGCQQKYNDKLYVCNDFESYYKKIMIYKRMNYLNELLNNINYYEHVDDWLIEKIKLFLIHIDKKNSNLQILFNDCYDLDFQMVNFFNIRKYCWKNKISYKLISSIIWKLLNLNFPIIESNEIIEIKNVFKKFESYYLNNKIENRKKMLSFSVILFHIFEKLNYQHLQKFILYPLIWRQKFYLKIWNEKFENYFYNFL